MAEIRNLQRLISKLQAKAAKVTTDINVSVVVGYTAGYALSVHERRNAYHPKGRAGFLLDVMRENAGTLRDIVRKVCIRGGTLANGLLMAGLRLQRESQKNCPVQTGNLRASAFTRLEQRL